MVSIRQAPAPPNTSIITTNWYSSKAGTPGTGNTSNTSLGFFQIYNDPTNNKTKNNGFWDRPEVDHRQRNRPKCRQGAKGNESRFSPFAGLGFADTQGEYLSYAFTATASGLQGVPPWAAFEDVTAIATGFSGSLNAIFQNTVAPAASWMVFTRLT